MKKSWYFIALVLILITVLYNSSTREPFYQMATPTFHVVIATNGRPTLINMLNSLKDELSSNDALTIIFDGADRKGKAGFTDSWLEGHKSKVNVIEQQLNTGLWGHPILNKYQGILEPKKTFIMFADDDDTYVPGTFNILRKKCTNPDTLYIGKMNYTGDLKKIIPSQSDVIKAGDIGKPCGIIPMGAVDKATWGYNYEGDFDYYNSIQKTGIKIEYLDDIIYRVTSR